MMTDHSMGYQPQPRTVPAAEAAAAAPDLYEVPLVPLRTITANLGGRPVLFHRPKQTGMRLLAKHGRSLMAAASAITSADHDDLDPALIEAQFDAFESAETVLRGLVPYMVADKEQRAWTLACFDHPEIDLTQLVGVLLRILGDLNADSAPAPAEDSGAASAAAA